MDIHSFDNIDDMFSFVEDNNKKAMKYYEDAGKPTVEKGQKYRLVSSGFIIYGEVIIVDKESIEYGYVTVQAYSEVCPYGEMGECPVIHMELITDEDFDRQLRKMQWGPYQPKK